jgi:hypothetical protein
MVKHECNECGLIFNKKSTYLNHKNRKTSCVLSYVKTHDNKYKCLFCNREYARSNLVKDHLQRCKEKVKEEHNNELTKIKDENEQLKEDHRNEISKLKEELEKYKKMYDDIKYNRIPNASTTTSIQSTTPTITTSSNSQQSTSNNPINNIDNSQTTNNIDNSTNNIDNSQNTNITNIDNSQTTNITIKFGEEDCNNLILPEIMKILRSGFLGIQEAVKLINCNPRLPEYTNAYISNIRSTHGHKFNGTEYELTDMNELINDIILNRAGDIKELLEKYKSKLNDRSLSSIRGLLKLIDENNEERMLEDKKGIKIMLYNNRDKVNLPVKPEKVKKSKK